MTHRINPDYITGAELLAQWPCHSREDKLESACKALMAQLETFHTEYLSQSLEENLENPKVFCSCADAYRMGHEALKP